MPNCLAVAFARAIGITYHELIRAIGHNGEEKVYINSKESRRGFHIQELIDVAMAYDRTVTEIQLVPILISSDGEEFKIKVNENRFMSYINMFRGVIAGSSPRGRHAVYWDTSGIIDGSMAYPLKDFKYDIDVFWIV